MQSQLACRNTYSGVHEAVTDFATVAPSPLWDSNSEHLLSDPWKGLQYLEAQKLSARLAPVR
jgi:hypothetical protein